jgi:carbon monoxide dehydrogenase subunit G
MKLEQSFDVSAPLQRVWEALIDVERVAPCLPGATVTGRNDDGSYNGEFKVKIGPTSAAYSGKLNMESVDEDSHHATMQAAGTDKRGQGGAKATIESSVEEIDAGTTKVNVSTDYHITGRLARFGRGGMIEEISNRLLREFAERLQAMLTSGGDGLGGSPDGTAAAATEAAAADTEAAAADTEAAAGGTDEPPAASSDEPPAAAAGSQGEPDAPGHAQEATAEANAAVPAQNAAADADPFAPAAPSPPPSGTAAGNAPPPASSPPHPPPPADNEPMQGLSLVGGAVFSQIRSKPAPFVGALVAILVAFRLLRRRGRG